ncbi:hypothetical protein HPP92_021753 [Vanilla planifolia]|uniref:Uncharacterized protein n=1 Tax=Vanilla planifolia TaxID=51239 RepID=A0A835PU14_VANPL|nr:hypothetical protein HPP92_021753 [Vanilla planifolia]
MCSLCCKQADWALVAIDAIRMIHVLAVGATFTTISVLIIVRVAACTMTSCALILVLRIVFHRVLCILMCPTCSLVFCCYYACCPFCNVLACALNCLHAMHVALHHVIPFLALGQIDHLYLLSFMLIGYHSRTIAKVLNCKEKKRSSRAAFGGAYGRDQHKNLSSFCAFVQELNRELGKPIIGRKEEDQVVWLQE